MRSRGGSLSSLMIRLVAVGTRSCGGTAIAEDASRRGSASFAAASCASMCAAFSRSSSCSVCGLAAASALAALALPSVSLTS